MAANGQMMDPMMNPMGGGFGPYPNDGMAMDPNRPNVIVLNNAKPSSKSGKKSKKGARSADDDLAEKGKAASVLVLE
jgi:hypothetical protein